METLDDMKQQVLNQSYDNSAYNYSIHHSEARNARAESENERRFNFEQSQLDKLFTIQMKDYEDAYNSPAAQKARFLAAGINPYLAMYGGASNQTGQTSTPSSHGISGSGAGAQASAGAAEAARLNAIVGAAGQLNDSVDSYYKNLITNEQAKQEAFNTQTQAEKYYTSLQTRVAELRGKQTRNKIEEKELESKENELEDYYTTRPELRKQTKLQNDFTVSATNKNIADAKHAEAQTETENVMRDVQRRAAEKGIQLTSASIGSIRNQAMLFFEQAQQISDEQFYMNTRGYQMRFRSDWFNSENMRQNNRRLAASFDDFLKELHNKRLISQAEYRIALARSKQALYDAARSGLSVVDELKKGAIGNKDAGVGGIISSFLK